MQMLKRYTHLRAEDLVGWTGARWEERVIVVSDTGSFLLATFASKMHQPQRRSA